MSNSRRLRYAAYHEAGHAVAAYFQRVRIDAATIIPGEVFDGEVTTRRVLRHHDYPEADASRKNRDRIEREAFKSIAGEAAQKRFVKKSFRSVHSSEDRHHARSACSDTSAVAPGRRRPTGTFSGFGLRTGSRSRTSSAPSTPSLRLCWSAEGLPGPELYRIIRDTAQPARRLDAFSCFQPESCVIDADRAIL